MARLRVYEHKFFNRQVYLVTVFENFDSERCVMFVDEDGQATYGTKEYLASDYELAEDMNYEIKISLRKPFVEESK